MDKILLVPSVVKQNFPIFHLLSKKISNFPILDKKNRDPDGLFWFCLFSSSKGGLFLFR